MKDYTYQIDNDTPQEKKRFIRSMFDAIVPTYDLLNHVLSLGTDRRWRRNIFAHIRPVTSRDALDIACGTGDLSRLLTKAGARVVSLDFSLPMLQRGRRKKAIAGAAVAGDAGALPLADQSVDTAAIAFGIRNIPDIDTFLAEAGRVLRPGGELAILELIRPESRLIGFFYALYLNRLLPFIGGLVSGRKAAYQYLARTIETFIDPADLAGLLRAHGFVRTAVFRQWPGVAVIIVAAKEEK
ncbi:MAG: ubiquinone/menaquinone biosynthesis methyltransferase [Desulfosudaceae bacterium]